MKRLMILLLCLCAGTLLAQENGLNRTDAQGRKQGAWKKYENGKLAYEGQFKDNVPYGTFTYYHTNGKMKSRTEFREGVHKVFTTIYHDNGHKASEGIFIDQLKDGEWRYYAPTDTLITVERYAKGKRTGCWRTFSAQNGMLLEEMNYLNDKRNGAHITYYTNGTPSLEEQYLDGKQNGKCTAYYPKGHISSTGNFHDGHRDGSWDFYDVNGILRTTMEYKNQTLTGTYVYLYIHGQGQKMNQNLIAYFMKAGDNTAVVLKNGRKIAITESLDDVMLWADFTLFTRITPTILAATDAITGYKPVKDDDEAIIVKLRPSPGTEVRAEGNEARMVKTLFHKELPKEE